MLRLFLCSRICLFVTVSQVIYMIFLPIHPYNWVINRCKWFFSWKFNENLNLPNFKECITYAKAIFVTHILKNIVGNGCLWKKLHDIQYIPQTSTFSNTMIYFSCFSFPGTYLSGRNVTAGYNLTVNQPPGVGNCSITPQSGLTLLTGFNVSCQGFSDPDSPLLYILSQVQTSGNV